MMKCKDLRIILKHGATTQMVCQKYGFETEEKLFEAIRKITPTGAEEIIRQLRKNDKRVRGQESIGDVKSEVQTDLAEVVEPTAEAEVDIEKVDDDTESESDSYISEMEQLEQDEAEMSNWLCGLEQKHKSLVAARREISEFLRATKQELTLLRKQIAKQSEAMEAKAALLQESSIQMRILDQEMSDYRSLLDDIRARMEELKQVFILVSSNGIEVENAEIPFIRDEDVSLKTDALLHHEAADELTVREIKTVAKLLLVVGSYEKYELMFDNSRMETFFEQVKSFAS